MGRVSLGDSTYIDNLAVLERYGKVTIVCGSYKDLEMILSSQLYNSRA